MWLPSWTLTFEVSSTFISPRDSSVSLIDDPTTNPDLVTKEYLKKVFFEVLSRWKSSSDDGAVTEIKKYSTWNKMLKSPAVGSNKRVNLGIFWHWICSKYCRESYISLIHFYVEVSVVFQLQTKAFWLWSWGFPSAEGGRLSVRDS